MVEGLNRYFPEGGVLTATHVATGDQRILYRPLDGISDLVVERMPEMLAQARQTRNKSAAFELKAESRLLARKLATASLPPEGTREHAVSRLDVMMLYTGLVHAGVKASPELSRLVRRFAVGGIPGVDYQDLVLVNPLRDDRDPSRFGDPRTYTHGEVGAQEEHFYLLHQDLEHTIKPAVESFKDALVTPSEGAVVIATGQVENLGILIANTRSSGRGLKRFDDFRGFLNGVPKKMVGSKLPKIAYGGPSGAYSGSVHALDLLVAGSVGPLDPKDEVITYVNSNRDLFPREDYGLIDEAIAYALKPKTLVELSPQMLRVVETYARQLLMFRHIHKGAVKRQIPQVLKDASEVGTGGINKLADFFERRIQRTEQVLQQISIAA